MTSSSTESETWAPVHGPEGVALRVGAFTHPGRLRAVNEDAWLARPPVFLVADGMGGHRLGDVASAIVVTSFEELALSESVDLTEVVRCIAVCQQRIASLADGSGAAPGSTLSAAVYVVRDGEAYWLLANIGDSRAYQLVDHRLEQLSHDHSVVQELIDSGAIAPSAAASHPERHVITRALGAMENAPADYSLVPARGGTKILLCSDGVSSELNDGTIAELLDSPREAREIAKALVTEAVDTGGHDNATAVVIEVLGTRVLENTAGILSAQQVDTVPGSRAGR